VVSTSPAAFLAGTQTVALNVWRYNGFPAASVKKSSAAGYCFRCRASASMTTFPTGIVLVDAFPFSGATRVVPPGPVWICCWTRMVRRRKSTSDTRSPNSSPCLNPAPARIATISAPAAASAAAGRGERGDRGERPPAALQAAQPGLVVDEVPAVFVLLAGLPLDDRL
jgi:hypothetical protein